MKRIHRLLDHPEPPHAALDSGVLGRPILVTAAVALAAWQPKPGRNAPQNVRANRRIAVPEVADRGRRLHHHRSGARRLQATHHRRGARALHRAVLAAARSDAGHRPRTRFKEEHYRRIAYANDALTAGTGLAGWKTDRGRIYITYGPPDEIESHPSDGQKPILTNSGCIATSTGIGEEVIIEFDDPARTGEYRMPDSIASRGGGESQAHLARRGEARRHAAPGARVRRARRQRDCRDQDSRDSDERATLGQAAIRRFPRRSRAAAWRGSTRVVNGTVRVTIQLDSPPPATAQIGARSGRRHRNRDPSRCGVRRTSGVAQPNSGACCSRSKPTASMRFPCPSGSGASINTIEVVSGLVPGDRVIVSDMRAYMRYERVQIK